MASLAATLGALVRHPELVLAMTQRDLKGFGRGAVLGIVWLVLAPSLQVAAYVALVAHWANILYVLSGMAVWQVCARTLQEATTLIRDRMELVKQVIYPVETLPATALLVSGVGGAVTLCIFLAVASWLLAVAGVLLKDLRDMVGVLLGLAVLVLPVVLASTMVSERVWSLVMLNPLAHVVVAFRDVLQGGSIP